MKTKARLAAARDAYLATHLMRTRTGADDDGGAWFALGGGHPELAGVLRVGSGPLAPFLATPAAGGLWHVWPGLEPAGAEERLLAAGFSFVEEEPVMVADLDSPAATEGPGARRAAEGWEIITAGAGAGTGAGTGRAGQELSRWSRVWDPGLPEGRRAGVAAGLHEVLELAPERSHYALGLLDGQPVACAAVFTAGGVSAVEHVVTNSGHRGRGLGTLMTQHCLRIARQHGAGSVLLTASDQGAGIYRRLGFRTVGTVRRYLAPRNL